MAAILETCSKSAPTEAEVEKKQPERLNLSPTNAAATPIAEQPP